MKTPLLFLILLCNLYAFSFKEKETTAERILKLKDRTLIVELPLKSVEYIKTLDKKGKREDIVLYEKRCKYIRESIKTAFSNYWKYKNKIVFVSSDSIEIFMKGETSSFAVMRYGNRAKFKLGEKYRNNYIMAHEKTRIFSLYLADEEDEVLFLITPFRASLGEFIISVKQFKLSMDVYLSHPDIKQSNVNSYVSSKEERPRYDAIETTVLIKREDLTLLGQEDVDESQISKVYPYKFKIVETAEWEKALINEDRHFSCLTFYQFPTSNNVCEAVDSYSSINMIRCDLEGSLIINIFVLHMAADAFPEGADPEKKIEKIMGGIKKQFDSFEEKAKLFDLTKPR